MSTHVTLPADVNRIDETGYAGRFSIEDRVPETVRPDAVVVAGPTTMSMTSAMTGSSSSPSTPPVAAPMNS